MFEDKKKVIVIAALVVAVIALGVLAFLLGSKTSSKGQEQIPTGNLTVDTTAQDLGSDKETEAGETVYFTATGFFDSELKSDDIFALPNDIENAEDGIYVIYIIMNGETEVYKSDLLEPGKQLNWIPGQTLDKGDYDITVVQVPYMLNEKTNSWDEKYSSKQTIKMVIK